MKTYDIVVCSSVHTCTWRLRIERQTADAEGQPDSVDSTTEAMVSGEKPEETDSEADNKKILTIVRNQKQKQIPQTSLQMIKKVTANRAMKIPKRQRSSMRY